MARAWIALGSNLGEREEQLARALWELEALPDVQVLGRSAWLETDPVGGPPGQHSYLNGVVHVATSLDPRALLAKLQEIEARAGRTRSERDAPRTLDLDLLMYDDLAIDEPELIVPHPRMEERTFVLAPLAELAPEMLLPRSGKTVRERLSELESR